MEDRSKMAKVKSDTFDSVFSSSSTLTGASYNMSPKTMSHSPTFFPSVSIMDFDLNCNIHGLTVIRQINGIL